MNMVEKVARAIQTADEQNGGWPYERVILEKHARNALFDRARAAIEAMREPTERMIDMGCAAKVDLYPAYEGEKPQPTGGDVASASYRAMIDAALQEE